MVKNLTHQSESESNLHIKRKTIIYNYILIAKDKLHETLIASVNEVNG